MKASLEELVKSSECYGLMYDSASLQCKRCEVWFRCEPETRAFIESHPDTVPEWANAVPGLGGESRKDAGDPADETGRTMAYAGEEPA